MWQWAPIRTSSVATSEQPKLTSVRVADLEQPALVG